MSADSFSVVTLVFPDPRALTQSGGSFQELNESVSFRYEVPGDVVTLSSTNANAHSDLTGLLYLPELDPGSSCENIISQYVPNNATSQVHLPVGTQYGFLAVAPWISPTCTQEFLYAARDDPLRAFMFFLPNNDTTVPPANDARWSLGDSGKWKKHTKFPVYAISGDSGGLILRQMGRYSGNLTTVPFGQMLADEFPPNAFVRLAGAIALDTGSGLPSLWVFLLIVLGILLFIIASTSCIMHCIQRNRRERLRQRVMDGDVDLERLGIKRLTVPRTLLEKMPLYTYPAAEAEEDKELVVSPPKEGEQPIESEKALKSKRGTREQLRQRQHMRYILSQPTCAICLDEFTPEQSTVRELPCHHVFHSECVDTFLQENSSLCPLCKKTSLPRGYCPPVLTNAMVRRERRVRRMRERLPRQSSPRSSGNWNPTNWQIWSRDVLTTTGRNTRRPNRPQEQELSRAPSPGLPPVPESTEDIEADRQSAPSPTSGRRREWARQRALAMVGRSRADAASSRETLEEDRRRRPPWRKLLGKIWPGVA